MDVAEVQDQDSLRRYLEGLPKSELRTVAARVAFKSAARTLPIAADGYFSADWGSRKTIRLHAAFGGLLLSAVSAQMRGHAIEAYVGAIDRVRDAVTDAVTDLTAEAAFASAAAVECAIADPLGSVAFSETAYRYAVFGSRLGSEVDFWDMIRHDLGGSISLWPDGIPKVIERHWINAQAALQEHPEDWEMWLLWYNRILQGRDWHPKVMLSVLQSNNIVDWRKGPTHINPMFDEVLALYREEDAEALITATPNGETVVFDETKQAFDLVRIDHVPPQYLNEVLDQIAAAARILESSEGGANAYRALSEELDILKDICVRDADKPVQILKNITRVQTRVGHKSDCGDCPSAEQDVNIADFQDVLTMAQLDLIALSPEVRAYHLAVRPAVDEADLAKLVAGVEAAQLVAAGDLDEGLKSSVEILKDVTNDETLRMDAQYVSVGRLVRLWNAIRVRTKEVALFVKDVGIIVGIMGIAIQAILKTFGL